MSSNPSQVLGLGTLSSLPVEVLWRVLGQLVLKDLLSTSQTCQFGQNEIWKSEHFWHFLYYLQLIPSPLYYPLQHETMLEPPTASWKFMYLEQLWMQFFVLLQNTPRGIRAVHRLLSSQRDATWQIVQSVDRGTCGLLGKQLAPLTFINHLGFKETKKRAVLEPTEVTGCFNYAKFPTEDDLASLLPDPATHIFVDEINSNSRAEDALKGYCALVDPLELVPEKSRYNWFSRGIRGFVRTIAAHTDMAEDLSDYWQEISELEARHYLFELITHHPPFIPPEEPSPLETALESMELETTLAEEEARLITNCFFSLAKLGLPTLQPRLVAAPIRCFIVSNMASNPFEDRLIHGLLVISPHRMMFMSTQTVGEFQSTGQSVVEAIAKCLGRT